METNENSRITNRSHPYAKSPGRTNFSKITHNFFSFSNNQSSLFPQAQQCPQEQQQHRFPLALKSTQSTVTSNKADLNVAPKRKPFQELAVNSNSRFIKLPSSCKISESSLRLIPARPDENTKNEESDSKKLSECGSEPMSTDSCHDQNEINLKICRSPSFSVISFQPDYCFDILSNWAKIQHRVRPRKYMDKQKEISYKMRSILVDWIVEVTQEFDCCQETLFLTVSIVDRFLSKMNVPKNKLQLIGITSLFIACKYEETNPPGIKDFVYITDDTYSKEQILSMEQIILQALNFDLMPPTCYDFVKSYCTLLQLDAAATCLAIYMAELTLVDGESYTTILPSLIATTAVALARFTYHGPFWDERLCTLSPHVKSDVQRCAGCLYSTFHEAGLGIHKAVYEKFKSDSFGSISISNVSVKLPWN